MNYPEISQEERENRELRKLCEKQEERIASRKRDIEYLAKDFYTTWVKEDEKLSKLEAKAYFERALLAAEVFIDGIGEID